MKRDEITERQVRAAAILLIALMLLGLAAIIIVAAKLGPLWAFVLALVELAGWLLAIAWANWGGGKR